MNFKKNSQLVIIMLAVLLDVLGIGIFIPGLEELTNLYNQNTKISLFGQQNYQSIAMLVTFGTSLYSLASFFSAPFLGQLSDRMGRKKPLLACILTTCLSYLALAFTHNIWVFLFVRFLNGVVSGNISILQSMICDISPQGDERTKNLGMIRMIFGLGFIIGPLIGSLVINITKNVNYIFLFGALFSMLEIFLISFSLKETLKIKNVEKTQFHPLDTLKGIKKSLQNPSLKYLLIATGFASLTFDIYQPILVYYFPKYFSIPGGNIGFFLALIGLVSAINQGYFLSHFWLKKFSAKKIMEISGYFLPFAFFVVALFPHSFLIFLIFMVSIIIINGTCSPILQNETVSNVDETKMGEINGVVSSVQTLGMFFGPIIGSYIHLNFNFSIFWICGTIALLYTFGTNRYLKNYMKA